MKLSGNRRITAGFVIGLALVILFSLAGFRTGAQYSQTVNDIVHSNATQASIFELQTELDEAETGQRGYVITGNATFLQPYQAAINSINGTLSQLQGLVVGDANLTSGYQQLQPLIQDELSELKQVVSVRQTQGFAAAGAIVNTGLGNEYHAGDKSSLLRNERSHFRHPGPGGSNGVAAGSSENGLFVHRNRVRFGIDRAGGIRSQPEPLEGAGCAA